MKLWVIVIAYVMLPAVTLAAPPPNEIRYTYVGGAGVAGEIDLGGGVDVDQTLGSIGGLVGVHDNIALGGSVSAGTVDTSSLGPFTDIDTSSVSLGAIVHFPLSSTIDLVIPVFYEWVELDDGFVTIDDSGYSIGGGIRALVTPAIELGIGISYVDIGSDSGDTSVGGSFRWHITDLVSLAIGAAASSDVTQGSLGIRFTFK